MSDSLDVVLSHLKQGDFTAAMTASERWCDKEPENPVAWNLRGAAALGCGAHAGACDCFDRALALQPSYAKARCNLGLALRHLGFHARALDAFAAAAAQDPMLHEAERNRAALLIELGEIDEALARIEHCAPRFPGNVEIEMLRVRCWMTQGRLEPARDALTAMTAEHPDHVDAWRGLGYVARDLGDLDTAARAFRQACLLAPADAELLHAHGVVLMRQGKPTDAVPWLERAHAEDCAGSDVPIDLSGALIACRRYVEAKEILASALRRWPDNAWLLYNLGCVESAGFRYESAKAALEQAVENAPDLSDAHHALGHVHEKLDNLDLAIACYQEALRINPQNANSHCNLGGIAWSRLRMDEAEEHYREAIRFAPDLANAHFNLGIVLLATGRFEEGWREYAWRDRTDPPAALTSRFPQPVWRGEDLRGKRLLIHAEQGMGDTLQFIRYAPMLRQHAAQVIVECQTSLKRLLDRMGGVDHVAVPGAALPEFDVQIPMLGIPGAVGTCFENVPCPPSYLSAYPQDVATWRTRIEACQGGLRVGIAWAGNPRNPNDRNRSMPPEQLAPLAAVDGVRWFCLQKEKSAEGDALASPLPGMVDWTADLDDFAATAALVENLDLVIAVDTSVVHLAGALGKPAWVMLPYAPDWRWLLGREDSVWYRSLRLFRQPAPGNWAAVTAAVVQALKRRVDRSISA